MKEVLIDFVALLALLVAAFVCGAKWQSGKDTDALTVAAQNVSTSASNADASNASLNALKAQFDDLKKKHDKALAEGKAALDGRDAQIATLASDVANRTETIRKLTRDQDDCKPLATVGICAAVASELWPAAKQAATDSASH